MSPYLQYGAEDISFWARQNTESTGSNFWEVQYSADSTNWTTAQSYGGIHNGWEQVISTVDILTPLYVRIIKTGNTGINQYLGLDNIEIERPPGVLLSNLALDPGIPSFGHDVHVTVHTTEGPNGSNATVRVFYRSISSSSFIALPMENIRIKNHLFQRKILKVI